LCVACTDAATPDSLAVTATAFNGRKPSKTPQNRVEPSLPAPIQVITPYNLPR
jgi:hypothetical protein